MKPLDLVYVRPEYRDQYNLLPYNGRFVFLGEINQMPGHGVFALLGTSKIFAGFHMDQFYVIEEKDV
jgi:hypothetical protein